MAGKILHQLGVASAEKNGAADQRGPEALGDVEDGFSPACDAATFEASKADVVLVGAFLSVGEMGEFEGDDDAIEDHGGAKAGADAEEEHAAALITAEGLHGGGVDDSEVLAEGLLIGKD